MALSVDIVEDDDAVRDSMRALLESYGYNVREYPSGADYLHRDDTAVSDCLIVDYHMPDMTGLELLEDMRVRRDYTPALILTGHNEPLLERRLIRAGVVKLLHKPIHDDELVAAIEEATHNAVRH